VIPFGLRVGGVHSGLPLRQPDVVILWAIARAFNGEGGQPLTAFDVG